MRKEKERIILLLILLLDQSFKWLAVKLNLAIINKGIAFGLFSSFPLLNFLILICVVSILIFSFKKRQSFTLALWLVLFGGMSNFLDRMIYGGVVDYLRLPFIPVFNLADVAITVGCVVVFLKIL